MTGGDQTSGMALDAARLASYLREKVGDVEVEAVQQIGGGASRETWLVTLREPAGRLPPLVVVRKDTPTGGTVPTPLDREYRVLEALSEHHLPVPTPYWFEAEESWFGAPFYIREGFEGTSKQSSFSGATAERLSGELASALARLHAVDPTVLESPDTPRPEHVAEAAEHEVERWATYWHDHMVEPMPMLEAVTSWLRRNRPDSTEPISIVWGDVGVANTVCSTDGRVLAMSDWELAGLGDPMRDVASALWRGVDRLAGRERFLCSYVEAGGKPIDEDRITYYDVFSNWQVAIFTHTAVLASAGGDGRGLHPALLSIWAQRINLHKAGRRIGI